MKLMNTQDTIYWNLLGVSNAILVTLWVISMHKLCKNNTSTRRRITFYSTCCIISNSLFYLAIIYPETTVFCKYDHLQEFSNIFEAFLIITCYHIFRSLSSDIMASHYSPYHREQPQWINIFHDASEIFMTITVPICYIFEYIFTSIPFIHICYIIVSCVVLMHSVSNLYVIMDILKILSHGRPSVAAFVSAKCSLKGAILVTIFITIVNITWIAVCVETITHQTLWIRFDQILMQCIIHSVIYIALTTALLWWYYQPDAKLNAVYTVFICSCCCTRDVNIGEIDNYQQLQSPHKHIDIDNETETDASSPTIQLEISNVAAHSEGLTPPHSLSTINNKHALGEASLIEPNQFDVFQNEEVVGPIVLTNQQQKVHKWNHAKKVAYNEDSVDIHVHDTKNKYTITNDEREDNGSIPENVDVEQEQSVNVHVHDTKKKCKKSDSSSIKGNIRVTK